MRRNEKPANRSERNSTRSSKPISEGSKRQPLGPASPIRADGRLRLPPGKPDIDALRSVTREWLVPRLVEKFLRVHGVELKHMRQRANRLQPSLLRDSAGAVPEEMRSHVKKKSQYEGLK